MRRERARVHAAYVLPDGRLLDAAAVDAAQLRIRLRVRLSGLRWQLWLRRGRSSSILRLHRPRRGLSWCQLGRDGLLARLAALAGLGCEVRRLLDAL
jgi:hypothetical protein